VLPARARHRAPSCTRSVETGGPSQDPALFPGVPAAHSGGLRRGRQSHDRRLPDDERRRTLQPALQFAPEVASLNMGSMNFGLYEMLHRFKEFKHDWERPYLQNSDDLVFRNSFRDIEHILRACSPTRRASRSSATTSAILYTAAHSSGARPGKAPLLIQSVFGLAWGHRRACGRPDAHAPDRRASVR
jgi:hypothetical protein